MSVFDSMPEGYNEPSVEVDTMREGDLRLCMEVLDPSFLSTEGRRLLDYAEAISLHGHCNSPLHVEMVVKYMD